MNVLLTPEAEADLQSAYNWYQSRGLRIADGFLRSFIAGMAMIERYPQSQALIYGRFRRMTLRRFPYCIYYSQTDDTVYVHGILHGGRSPEVWKRRLR